MWRSACNVSEAGLFVHFAASADVSESAVRHSACCSPIAYTRH